MRFEVLTFVAMKIMLLWNETPCSLVDFYHLFESTACMSQYIFCHQDRGLMFLTNVLCVYQTANHHMPEDSDFQKLCYIHF
jgi:hypothetical protein